MVREVATAAFNYAHSWRNLALFHLGVAGRRPGINLKLPRRPRVSLAEVKAATSLLLMAKLPPAKVQRRMVGRRVYIHLHAERAVLKDALEWK
jgi:hypothetical protein